MKKRTAKRLIVFLTFSYFLIIAGAAFLVIHAKQGKDADNQTLSEADASDNVGYGGEEQATSEEYEDNTTINSTEDSNEIVEDADSSIDSSEDSLSIDTDLEDSLLQETATNLVFTGDVYIGNYVGTVYDSAGIDGVVSSELQEIFCAADIAMVNEEFPFSTRGTPMEDKQYTFRVDPAKVSLLTDLGIDIVSLANNHTLDYGLDALTDTFTTLTDAGIVYSGAGENITEARTIRYFETGDKTIAYISASRVIPVADWAATKYQAGLLSAYDPTATLEDIAEAKETADVVVVYIHWGLEQQEYPESYQQTMGRQFIDAGADLVIGSHPHVLQGFEYYQGKLIAYSLGNFIFSQTIESTALLDVEISEDNELNISVLPCSTTDGLTALVQEESAIQERYDYLESISYGVSIDENGMLYEEQE